MHEPLSNRLSYQHLLPLERETVFPDALSRYAPGLQSGGMLLPCEAYCRLPGEEI